MRAGRRGAPRRTGRARHRLRQMAAPASAEEIRDVNTRYHDAAAEHYDTKWGVDYGDVGRNQVRGKLHKLLGKPLPTFGRSLEIGCGTALHAEHAPGRGRARGDRDRHLAGMLDVAQANAARIGVDVTTVACDAEALPFADDSFDLVLGHAVLHRIPNLDRAFAEFERVLEPGGRFVFAGEPSRSGDRIAAIQSAPGCGSRRCGARRWARARPRATSGARTARCGTTCRRTSPASP